MKREGEVIYKLQVVESKDQEGRTVALVSLVRVLLVCKSRSAVCPGEDKDIMLM